jgi:hypothetical protein
VSPEKKKKKVKLNERDVHNKNYVNNIIVDTIKHISLLDFENMTPKFVGRIKIDHRYLATHKKFVDLRPRPIPRLFIIDNII